MRQYVSLPRHQIQSRLYNVHIEFSLIYDTETEEVSMMIPTGDLDNDREKIVAAIYGLRNFCDLFLAGTGEKDAKH